ncbi:hypothetical protein LSPH24S_09147 [Lysinibacillus sphaericus]
MRIPFLLEGMWLGILGSIIPIAVVATLYHNVYKIIAPRLQGELVQLLQILTTCLPSERSDTSYWCVNWYMGKFHVCT